jgi:glycosyltransferase involved in cell wall biosynthesis
MESGAERARRILVIGAYPPSLINFRGELLEALVARGHQVIAMAGGQDQAVATELAARGVEYRSYRVQRNGLNPLVELWTCLMLWRALREIRPDVVLAYTIKPVIWAGIAARGLRGVRFVALVEGLGYAFHGTSPARKAFRYVVTRLYRKSLKGIGRIVFLNPDNRDEFVKRGIAAADRCELVDGAGVDTTAFQLAPFPDGPVVFLTIARLLGEKGLREFAAAARRVRERHADAAFRLVGPEDASPDRIPMAEIRSWQEAGVVEYMGATDDVRPHIAGCHVYVLASYHEGMPRTVLEAMAMGRPILTTRAPGCRETVLPGENGFLVPVGDVAALADRMSWFLENRSEINRMGLRGRRLVLERFDVRIVNDRMLGILGVEA